MAEDTSRIEITFPVPVELTNDDQRVIDAIAAEVCDRWERAHPGRVMWPAGIGSKITYMPMTRAEELAGKHMEFDTGVLSIDCAERADYSWLCAKCGIEQGEHKDCMADGKAGDCDFEPVKKDLGPAPERGIVPMRVYVSAVNGRRDMRQAFRVARDHAKAVIVAAEAVADDACSMICPSTGKAGEPIPHSDRCIALRAAIAAVQQ